MHNSIPGDIYTSLTCVNEIQMTARSDKYIIVCYYIRAALRVVRPAKATSHWDDNTQGRWMAFLLTPPCDLSLFDSLDILVLIK
jgi:hypothetical protein